MAYRFYSSESDAVTGTVADLTAGRVFHIVDSKLHGTGYHVIAMARGRGDAKTIVKALNAYHKHKGEKHAMPKHHRGN